MMLESGTHRCPSSILRITYVAHSTVLIQVTYPAVTYNELQYLQSTRLLIEY